MKISKDLRDPPARLPAALNPRTWLRTVVFVLAWFFLAVGIGGLFVPLVPGTLFLILAGACFTHSSPRFEAWLLDHPRFGPPVRQWRATGAIPRKAKVFACISLAVSWLILLATDTSPFVVLICFAVFILVAVYVGTRPDA